MATQDAIEYIILKNLFEVEDFFNRIIVNINQKFLINALKNKSCKKIVKAILNFYNDKKVIPKYNDIFIILNEEERKVINSLKKRNELLVNFDELIERTETYIKSNLYMQNVSDNMIKVDTLGYKDQREALDELKLNIKEIDEINLKEETHFRDLSDINFFDEYIDKLKTSERIKTGWKYLDFLLGGGFLKEKMQSFIAGTGVGKTMAQFNIGINASRNGNNVLYITLEISEGEMMKRIYSNLGNCNIHNMERKWKNEYKSKIKNSVKNMEGDFKLVEYGINTMTIEMLEKILEKYADKYDYKPDLLVVDSGNLVKVPSNFNDNLYLKGQFIGNELQRIATEHEISVLTSAQLNREGSKKANRSGNATMQDIAESFAIPQVSDVVMGAGDSEGEDNTILVNMLKNRNTGRNGYLYLRRNIKNQMFEEVEIKRSENNSKKDDEDDFGYDTNDEILKNIN